MPVKLSRGCRAVRAALEQGRTRLLMLESPTNPRMQICDIATLSRIAHEVPSSEPMVTKCNAHASHSTGFSR